MESPLSIGCCAGEADLAVLQRLPGLDFVELPVTRALMSDAAAFEQLAGRFVGGRLAARAANVFLPADLRVVGPEASLDRLCEYTVTALDRARRLGVEVLVFGSGRSRSVPAGFAHERALDQFESAVRAVHEEASARGVTLAIEPLHAEETNLLTSVAEAAAFIRDRDLAGVRLTADLWHMRCADEDLSALAGASDLVAHAHVAAAERWAPGQAPDEIVDFLGRLRAAGYGGRCSIECRWTDFAAEVGGAVARVRAAATTAGWSAA